MPTVRKCTKCGQKHGAPTGKKCAQVVSSQQSADAAGTLGDVLAGLHDIKAGMATLTDRVTTLEGLEQAGHTSDDGASAHNSIGSLNTAHSLRNSTTLKKQLSRRMRELALEDSSSSSSSNSSGTDEDSEPVARSRRQGSRKGKQSKKSGRIRTTEEVIV